MVREKRMRGGLAWTMVLLAIGLAQAADFKEPPTLRKTIEERYPQLHILSVRAAEIPGLYEVYTGEGIIYSDAAGNYLLSGQLIDSRTKADITKQHLDALNSVDFDKLPLDQAIKTVRGNGERRIAVFEDPDCPYCKQLEKELQRVDNVTVYTFLYPLTALHPAARVNAHAIWCAADPSRAWRDWMLEGKIPASAATCPADPIEPMLKLGKELHINSTPVMFMEHGKRVSGAQTAGEIEALLQVAGQAGKVAAGAASQPPRS
jgi:thiol:disulfide interchange protein DsbC